MSDVLEKLAENITGWPKLLPRESQVMIDAGTVTAAHNEIERLRKALRVIAEATNVTKPAMREYALEQLQK